ncbi:terpene synthase family protein [Streptomyces sp. NPDC052396]|uniref:terpene synthase family protein n=1 Tax=Streptomyces sp. NPDC052396 TaxID=3365689 RepID=UPI0037CFACDF
MSTHHAILHYPDEWVLAPDPELHEEPERLSCGWLASHGLLETAALREANLSQVNGHVAADFYPLGLRERMPIMAAFCGLWYLHDNKYEGVGAYGRESWIRQAILDGHGDYPSEDPEMRAWTDYGAELRSLMSGRWVERYANHMRGWEISVIDEAEAMKATGIYTGVEQLLAVRRQTVGMHIIADLIEFMYGRELPAAIFEQQEFQELWRLFVDLGVIDNELFSYTTDLHNRWYNLITSLAHERHCTIPEAFDIACDLHNAHLDRWLTVERHLREVEGPGIDWWLNAAHYALTGGVIRNSRAPRYSLSHGADDVTVQLHLSWQRADSHV